MFLIHLSSYTLLIQYWPDSSVGRLQTGTGVNEVCVPTRFCGVRGNSVAPWSRSYGVVGLYLNLVLGPGIQALYCGLTGPPCSPHILDPVLLLAVCPPHTQLVSHSLWTAVVLRLWKRLQGNKEREEREKRADYREVFCHLLFLFYIRRNIYRYIHMLYIHVLHNLSNITMYSIRLKVNLCLIRRCLCYFQDNFQGRFFLILCNLFNNSLINERQCAKPELCEYLTMCQHFATLGCHCTW